MVQVKIRCGEFYDFNIIKEITDKGNGVIEIRGNFKPRGRYKSVRIWKQTIVNWDELTEIFKIRDEPYFCLKCKRTHLSGDKFYEHQEYRGKKEDLIPHDRILKADLTKLGEIGKRQLQRLLNRMDLNPGKSDLYRYEINKLILYEGINDEEIF